MGKLICQTSNLGLMHVVLLPTITVGAIRNPFRKDDLLTLSVGFQWGCWSLDASWTFEVSHRSLLHSVVRNILPCAKC